MYFYFYRQLKKYEQSDRLRERQYSMAYYFTFHIRLKIEANTMYIIATFSKKDFIGDGGFLDF